jgi:hypothetical protein
MHLLWTLLAGPEPPFQLAIEQAQNQTTLATVDDLTDAYQSLSISTDIPQIFPTVSTNTMISRKCATAYLRESRKIWNNLPTRIREGQLGPAFTSTYSGD